MQYTSQEEHDHFEGAAEQSVPQKPMTSTEKRLADRRMAGKSTAQGMMLLEHIYKGEKYTVFDSIRNKVHIIPDKHLKELIHQALAEERKRVVVSWDIADGGTEWVVQFWKVEVDGTKTLLQQLDKDSDDGGSFYLSSLDKPLHKIYENRTQVGNAK